MTLTEKLDKLAADQYKIACRYPADMELLYMIMQNLATKAAKLAIEDLVQPGKSS